MLATHKTMASELTNLHEEEDDDQASHWNTVMIHEKRTKRCQNVVFSLMGFFGLVQSNGF